MSKSENIEAKLLKACLKNDRKAQSQLYEKYKVAMFNLCQRYAKNSEEAEDILQEGFFKVFTNLEKFRGESTLGGWIKGVMINTALMHLRTANRKLFPTVPLDGLESDFASDEDVFEQFGASAILQMLQQLPPGYRAVFSLYAVEGFSHKEIAQKLDILESTSRSQFLRAKALLKKSLERHILS